MIKFFSKEKIIALAVVLIFFIIGNSLIINNSQYMENKIDELSNQIADSQSKVLEKSILRTTSSAVILGNHIHTVNGNMNDFDEYAKKLYSMLDGITNLQLAPNGVVRKIYPLVGHEKAIGHDIFKSDQRKREAFLAKKSKELTVAGPFELIQGGIAIVARSPIYLHHKENLKIDKHHIHVNADIFWGFASTLVYLDDLLKTTDLHQLKDKNYLFRLWRHHPDTNKVSIFAGTKELPNKKIFTRTISVPNSIWYLDIEYIGKSISPAFLNTMNLVNILVSILLGYLAYLILIRPKELQEEVALKTKELKFKNDELLKEQLELEKLTNAITYNNNAIFIADENGKFEYINPSFMNITGYTLNDISTNKTEIFKKEILKVLSTKVELKKQVTCKDKNDEDIILSLRITLIKGNEQISSLVGICEDITKQIKDTEDLRKKELLISEQAKLASMGEMIENIAHQWRQPLSVISTISSGIKFQCEFDSIDTKEITPAMNSIIKQSKYLSNTIDDFRNFIKSTNKKEDLSVKNVLEQTLSIMNSSLVNNNIELILNIEDDKIIDGYENELVQVFINIINNAKDAIKDNSLEYDDQFIFIDTQLKDDLLIVDIKDNAGGIKEDVIERVFEPYFTTKHQSIGTGIGLSMAYKIITEHHHASINVSNEEFVYNNKNYSGAKFNIIFS